MIPDSSISLSISLSLSLSLSLSKVGAKLAWKSSHRRPQKIQRLMIGLAEVLRNESLKFIGPRLLLSISPYLCNYSVRYI
jgi:hypothetical protein